MDRTLYPLRLFLQGDRRKPEQGCDGFYVWINNNICHIVTNVDVQKFNSAYGDF